MPIKIPNYQLPELPSAGKFGEWLPQFQSWVRDVGAVLQRNWKQIEQVPTIAASVAATTAVLLTTASTAIPGLSATVNAPLGSDLVITSFLDLNCDTAAGGAIGELYMRRPTSTAFSLQSTVQVLNVPQSGAIRGTFGQQWVTRNLPAGEYAFQIRGRALATTTAGAIVGQHSILNVQVT